MDAQTFHQTYQNIRAMKHGGIGMIYQAYHANLGKDVVLKQILAEKNLHMSRREVDILKNLRHRYLPQIYDFITVEQTCYIVEDYIPGKSMEDYIKANQRFSQQWIVKWLRQMCDVLEYLHTRTPVIIHSDIKPGNIMIDKNGDICLIDFNISMLGGKDRRPLGYSGCYASPEQIQLSSNRHYVEGTLDVRSDLYSTGAVFYTLMTGCLPDPRRIIPLSQRELPYSSQLLEIVDRCMERNVNRRYQTAKQIRQDLQQMEHRTVRWKTYKKVRWLISAAGTLMVVCGILCTAEGIQLKRENEFKTQLLHITSEYQQQGAVYDIKDQALKLLNERTYKRMWSKFPNKKAELLGMEGEYYYQQDTKEGYSAAAEYYEQALQCLNSDGDIRKYALNYASALAMSGNAEQAKQALMQYIGDTDSEVLAAVEIEAAYSQEDYEQVLELSQSFRSCTDGTIRESIFTAACASAQKLQRWEEAVQWSTRLAKADPTDAHIRAAAEICLAAASEQKETQYLNDAITYYTSMSMCTESDMLGLAQAQYEAGKYTRSMQTLQKIQTEDTAEQYRKFYYQSMNAAQLGDIQNAKTYCLKAVTCYADMTQKQKQTVDAAALQRLNEQLGTGKVIKT